MKTEITPSDWLRILTNNTMSAKDVAMCEGCSIKTARKIVETLNGYHREYAHHRCGTDDYLVKYRGTSRAQELRLIYGEVRL